MKWFRTKKNRLITALAVGAAIVLLMNTGGAGVGNRILNAGIRREVLGGDSDAEQEILSEEDQNLTPLYAWWGTLYPKFCFSERKNGKLKISFWVAKAFDWC